VDTFLSQIDWSQVSGFVMAVAVVVFIFERAWTLYQKATHRDKGDKDDEDSEPVNCRVPPDVDVRGMAQQIAELYDMHEVFDSDGVRVWYLRRSFYEMMEKSSEALQKISALLPLLVDNQRKMDHRLEDIQHNTQRRDTA